LRRFRIDNRRRTFPDIGEILRYRDLVALLGRRDITARYRQTALGTVWIFASALVTAGLFSFVFGRIAGLPTDGIPYFVFSYAGLLAWNLFANALTSVSSSLNPNASLISKIYFPRLVLPLSTYASTLLNTLISFGVMLVLLVVYGISITLQMLLLPVWLLLALILSMGIGLVLAAYSVAYRDVGFATPVVVSLLLYLSPVAYSLAAVPDDLRNLYLLNPVATIVEGTRWSLLGTPYLPAAWAIAYTCVFSIAVLFVGLAVFTRREAGFADVI
jgi:lipopolysaccharide transport system permease protein